MLDDGIYTVKRGMDMSLGTEKTLHCEAYNDYHFKFLINRMGLTELGKLGDGYYSFAAHWGDGEVHFQMLLPEGISQSDEAQPITRVLIRAFYSGKGRLLIRESWDVGATVHYSPDMSNARNPPQWHEWNMETNPATGLAWSWEDFTGTEYNRLLIAGVDLRKGGGYTGPYVRILNDESTASDENILDPGFSVTGARLWYFEAYICTENNPAGFASDVEWQHACTLDSYLRTVDVGYDARIYDGSPFGAFDYPPVAIVIHNPINRSIDGTFLHHWSCINFELFTTHYSDPFDLRIEAKDDWETPSKLKIDYYCAASAYNYGMPGDPYYQKPFLLIGGTRYYGTESLVPSDLLTWHNYNYTWSVNPATSAAWQASDMDGLQYGIEFRRQTTPYPLESNDGNASHSAVLRTQAYTGGIRLIALDSGDAEIDAQEGGVTHGSPYTWASSYIESRWNSHSEGSVISLACDFFQHDADDALAGDRDDLYYCYESDFAELPPSHSQINSLDISISARGWAANEEGSFYRLYLNIGGDIYYSDTYNFSNVVMPKKWVSPYTYDEQDDEVMEHTFTWATNPATGLAWTLDELQRARFGVRVDRETEYDVVVFRPSEFTADIDYQEIAGPLQPEYKKISAIDESITLQKNSNSPTLTPDILLCTLPVGGYLPERTELVMIRDRQMIFHGFIWTVEERTNRELRVVAKSQSAALECRYLRHSYRPHNGRRQTAYTIDSMFSDDVPTYLNYSSWMKYESPFYEMYAAWLIPENPALVYFDSQELLTDYNTLEGVDPDLGIFFILNSSFPFGSYEDEKILGVASAINGKLKFLAATDPSTAPFSEAAWLNAGLSLDFTALPDLVGSVRRFRLGADPNDLAVDEYAIDGRDLVLPGSGHAVLVDHLMDTFLRPGTNDLGESTLVIPYLFNGSFAKGFSDFFQRMGQEVRFRNELDGYVYMDAASEISRHTAKKYINGQRNATVTVTLREPVPDAAIGSGDTPGVSTTWGKARTWLSSVIATQRTGQDLQEWLNLQRDEDDRVWTIRSLSPEWHLRPGDYVWVQEERGALEEVRIQKVRISHAGTTITAGKRLTKLSETMGEWQSIRGSTDANTDYAYQSQEIDLGGPAGSQEFTVCAEDYSLGTWKCKLEIDWTLWVRDGYTADLPAGLQMVLIAKINDKVIPPGRLIATGNSGSVVLDITDWCDVSASADIVNEVSIELVNGITPNADYGHKITGTIKQYHRLEAVSSA